MIETDVRTRSTSLPQTLVQFDPRKLAMSLLGGAGKIRTHVRDGVDSERNPSVSVEH